MPHQCLEVNVQNSWLPPDDVEAQLCPKFVSERFYSLSDLIDVGLYIWKPGSHAARQSGVHKHILEKGFHLAQVM